MIEWWDKREENAVAWKVAVEDLKDGFDLDNKNPHREEAVKELSTKEVLSELNASIESTRTVLKNLEKEIG